MGKGEAGKGFRMPSPKRAVGFVTWDGAWVGQGLQARKSEAAQGTWNEFVFSHRVPAEQEMSGALRNIGNGSMEILGMKWAAARGLSPPGCSCPCPHAINPLSCRGAGDELWRSQHPSDSAPGVWTLLPPGNLLTSPVRLSWWHQEWGWGRKPHCPWGITNPRRFFVSESQNGLGGNGFKAHFVPSSALGSSHWTRLLQTHPTWPWLTPLRGIWGHWYLQGVKILPSKLCLLTIWL